MSRTRQKSGSPRRPRSPLSQLMNPALNAREDGRSPLLLLRRIVEEIREQAPAVAVDVRVSLFDEVRNDGVPNAERICQLGDLASLVDMVSLSAGHQELSRQLIYPSRRDGENVYVAHAVAAPPIGHERPRLCDGRIILMRRDVFDLDVGVYTSAQFATARWCMGRGP
jgi:hypothetical protein